MSRFKLMIEYDGTPFSGWQRQRGANTIQERIESALVRLTSQPSIIFAAGRTDAGVHARGQVIHVDIDKLLRPFQIQRALNALLRPWPISILNVSQVDVNFHARFSARRRYYQYVVINRMAELTCDLNRAWLVYKPLDIKAMQGCLHHFLGTHDFTSFRATECQAASPIKTIDALTIYQVDEKIFIDIASKSFLHHQVRNIVGTLKLIGEGKLKDSDVPLIIAARDRRRAGPTAPACGLTFMKVDY